MTAPERWTGEATDRHTRLHGFSLHGSWILKNESMKESMKPKSPENQEFFTFFMDSWILKNIERRWEVSTHTANAKAPNGQRRAAHNVTSQLSLYLKKNP